MNKQDAFYTDEDPTPINISSAASHLRIAKSSVKTRNIEKAISHISIARRFISKISLENEAYLVLCRYALDIENLILNEAQK